MLGGAPAPTARGAALDEVLTSGAFQHFATTVRKCMDDGTMAPRDPLPIVLELWSVAHGITSLLLAKPFLPWGDAEAVASRVMGAACLGYSVLDLIGTDPPTAESVTEWLRGVRQGRPPA
ncbi:TetR-like C-terminal domain-containing protein [Nocardia gipuzkoensis]|uniref:TetR-like C-terminal domain-containing protein n=1 Tax=Nocardia gipuzkoensis TaxID=2749991 RepID=UPI002454B6CB|nr:TetR-like C-terminal domain-containing protein [Nocardia gipuzkoensis]